MELVINTFGTSLNTDNEGFVISSKDGRQRIPTDGITSIQISHGAQITSDAVFLAIQKEIEVLFCDKTGNPIGRIWSPQYGSISTIRKGQVNFSFSHDAVEWIKAVIQKKIENEEALIMLFSTSDMKQRQLIQKSVNRLEDYRNKIGNLDGDIIQDISSTIRGWEGLSAKIYFGTLNSFIPEKYRFSVRTQRPAMDVANAMLNYGYGLLYGKIEGLLIKSGIDPYVGILHRDNYNRPVLVYDVIELYRVWIDYVVYTLLCQDVVTDEYYSTKDDGSVWLENLGRRVLIQSVNDYLDEAVNVRGENVARKETIKRYCQQLAKKFKEYE